MALTKKDKQFILEALGTLRLEMKSMEKGLWAGMNGLKIYMETQFRNINNRFDRLERIVDRSSLMLDDHENRIIILEDKTWQISKG